QVFPLLLGCVVIFLAVVQLIKNGWEAEGGDVLDLGMQSAAVEGRGRSAMVLFGLIALFLVLSVCIGLQYAAIVLAAAAPLPLMTGSRRWAWGILSGGIIALLVAVLFDRMLHVIWPEPLLWAWLKGTVI
ncbi:MAG TPA: tripartite tricarboxylate transporter TctB family protein, partial [Gammaproteobacteria bacterium]|nr:tripartite tricarboxylate transporter TctB family protein [Gammaproteobacteria bacterium]